MQNIILYTNHCPKCEVLKQKLIAINVQYKEIDNVEKMLEMGLLTTPMLKVDNTLMNFNEAINWIRENECI